LAWASTGASHSPSRLSAVRSRWAAGTGRGRRRSAAWARRRGRSTP
jgi:hypothetical protein